MAKVRVAAVSYINTIPFLFGLQHHSVKELIELIVDSPSNCVKMLNSGEVDLALIPVVFIPDIIGGEVASRYCIAALQEIRSFVLAMNGSLSNLSTLYLDMNSRTSITTARVLSQHSWRIAPELKPLERIETALQLRAGEGAILLGDNVLGLEASMGCKIDMAHEWRKFTGLPFVLAAWVSNRKLPSDFMALFNDALKYGINHLDEAVLNGSPKGILTPQETRRYLTENISYIFDNEKMESMKLFQKLHAQLETVPS